MWLMDLVLVGNLCYKRNRRAIRETPTTAIARQGPRFVTSDSGDRDLVDQRIRASLVGN
jgi:hypothetical protein